MQSDDVAVYDLCPDCGRRIPCVAGLADDEDVECATCPWEGSVGELTRKTDVVEALVGTARQELAIGSAAVGGLEYPHAEGKCPGFDPGDVLSGYGGRRCRNCGVREPSDVEVHTNFGTPPEESHAKESGVEWRTVAFFPLMSAVAYPQHMLEDYRHLVRVLPVGTVLDRFGTGPGDYIVVTGHELLPAVAPRNTEGAYFTLNMSRMDGTTRFEGTRMSFVEALHITGTKRVGMLQDLVP